MNEKLGCWEKSGLINGNGGDDYGVCFYVCVFFSREEFSWGDFVLV